MPFSLAISCRVTMFGWFRAEAARASDHEDEGKRFLLEKLVLRLEQTISDPRQEACELLLVNFVA